MRTGRFFIVGAMLCAATLFFGCGKMGPPVPPDLPTAFDDSADVDKKKVQIVDDSAQRIYELYGDPEISEQTPAPVGTLDSLDEVPDEYRYLYKKDDKDDTKTEQDETNETKETE